MSDRAEGPPPRRAMRAAEAATLGAGLFVLYTSGAGPFDSLVQRAVFLALVIAIGLLLYTLGKGRRWRPLGIGIDLLMAAVTAAGCGYTVVYADWIMDSLPTAGPVEIALIAGLVAVILELSRRAIGIVFPTLVVLGLAYALLGDWIPGRLGHRGFDVLFVTETLLLGDLGLWGLLMGVAATVIAAFTLFGSLLLHAGAGQTFIDLSLRLGGRSPGGAAKIATIASGIFGTISGSAVANVATTGNLTIPLMKRLNYPPAFAGAVEAVASTGGQLAPPIMGAGAFIMAEILGIDYLTVAAAGVLPALFFYSGVFATIHVYAVEKGLGAVPEMSLPGWAAIVRWRRLLPIAAAFGGLIFGIVHGNSIQTACFYGMVGTMAGFGVAAIGQRDAPAVVLSSLGTALRDAGQGLFTVGILLAGAQILVSMINLTGLGVTLSTLIVSLGGDSQIAIALIVAVVCMVLGMGIPTTAAYVLVAAVLAPSLIRSGVDALAAHMFVFYYATLSVITPPVCIAVFVAAGIAQTSWQSVARYALALGAVTYVIPFLFVLYPGLPLPATLPGFADGLLTGMVFVLAFAALFGGLRVTGIRALDGAAWLAVAALAVYPDHLMLIVAIAAGAGLLLLRRRRSTAAVP